MKKLLITSLLTLLAVSFITMSAYANEITVTVDGQRVDFEGQPPALVEGRTLVPVRIAFEALGFEVEWEVETSTAVLTSESYEVRIAIGQAIFYTNGVAHDLDVPAQLIGGRTMLPLRFPLESVGYSLNWNSETQTVVISSNPMPDILQQVAGTNLSPISITDDTSGAFNFTNPQPLVDEERRVMFPLAHFDMLFRTGLSYEIDGDTVIITKNILNVITTVRVTVGSYIMLLNEEEIEMDVTPIRLEEVIYIPLGFVGSALGYRLTPWDDRFDDGYLRFIQPTSMFIYVWNENEDSLPEGVRFSYVISGQNITELAEIKARATADFEEVFAVISELPDGDVLTTALYRVNGYKIPQEIFGDIISRIFDAGYGSGWSRRLLDDIPPIITAFDDWANRWHSESLFALGEAAIHDSAGQVYRFYNSHRRFSDKFVVRVEINDDGTANVYYRIGDGESGPHRGGLLRSEQTQLNEAETQEFLDLLNEIDFWNLPAEIDSLGLGGNDVLFEGVKDGEYHIVYRWVPESFDPVFYKVEQFFRNLVSERF